MKKNFKSCPRCQKKLNWLNKKLINCPSCDFHFYFNPVPATAIILENQNQEILLVKRRFSPKKGYWDLPGGFIDFKEKADEALKREVKEELNIEIEKINFLDTYIGFYPYKGINYQPLSLIFYKMISEDQLKNIKPADDVSSFKFFPKNKIPWKRLAFIDIKKGIKDYLKKIRK